MMEATRKTKAPISHPVSAETVTSNDDLLIEILLRMPIKSLIKFKSVSKHWFSLISDPGFSRRRSSSLISASGLFLRRRIGYIDDEFEALALSSAASVPPFPSTFSGDEATNNVITQSCNGLLLCSNFRGQDRDRSYYVYNPTTKHYATLPLPPYPDHRFQIDGFAIAFDPSKSPHYKVIAVINYDLEEFVLNISVYSSESGSWRTTQATLDRMYYDFGSNCQVIFCNGSVHWMMEDVDFGSYFNLATEEIQEFETIESSCYYGASRDRLHAVDNDSEIIDNHFNVFELEKDYSKWVVKYRVNISELLRAFPEMIFQHSGRVDMKDYNLSAICVVRCENEEDSFLVMNFDGRIMVYNFRTGSFYHLSDCATFQDFDVDDVIWEEQVFEYVESLACV